MSNDLEKAVKIVAKGAGIVFIGMIISSLIGMVNGVLLARFMGAEYYGVYNLALSLIQIASVLAIFGLFVALSRFIPFHLELGEKAIVKSAIRFSSGFVLCISILIAVIIFIFSERLATDIFHDPNLTMPLRFFSIGLPLVTLPSILSGVIRGFKAVKYIVAIESVGEKLVKLVVFIPFIFILIGYRLFGAIAAYLTSMIFTIFTYIFIIRKKLFPDYSEFRTIPIGKKLLSFALPLALTGVTFLFAEKTDVILLGYYITSKDIGIYQTALNIGLILNYVGISFSYIFLPVISGLIAKGKTSILETLFKSSSKWMFLIVFPMFLYILLFSKEVLTLLYGIEYSEAYLALVILTFGVSMTVFTGLTGNVLVGMGHTKLILACEVIAAITNVSLNIILIPIYGIIGAAIGTAASFFTRNLFSLIFVYKISKMHPYSKGYLKIVLVGIVVFGIIYLMKSYIANFLYWPILMLSLGFFLLFLFAVLSLTTHVFDKNDKILVKAIEKKLGRKLKFVRKFM